MIKLGIHTITGYNYGNRLQNYALQEVLRGLGCEVETLLDISDRCFTERVKSAVKYIIKKDFRANVKKQKKPYQRVQHSSLERWNKNNMKFSKLKFSRYHIPSDLGQRYDYFVAGSDQVWNPYFCWDTLMLLSYVPSEKRISYAASFGVSEIPEEFKKNYKNELPKFKAISVREQSGVDIVKDITGKAAVRVIDPTMMITIDEWRKVETRPKWLQDGKYILLYSIGGVPKHIREFADKIARENGMSVYEIMKEDDKLMNTIDPFEFVYLIDNAEFTMTDSFHGTVFSILSKTPFVIFGRGDTDMNMNSRFDTLQLMFSLKNRVYTPEHTLEQIMSCDFSGTDAVLEKERAAAKQFLIDSLEL